LKEYVGSRLRIEKAGIMNTTMKLGGGVVAACAACCAVSVVPALLAGTSIVALGGAALAWGTGLLLLAVPVAGVYYLSRRQTAVSSAGCGCASTTQDEAVIACKLGAGDFKTRTTEIRDLARRSLRHASRRPLTLTLTYEPDARDEVHALVAKEQECCPFLTFSVREKSDAIEVAIIAPAAAAEAADTLFDHFAPELAASNTKEIA
jgi:hypothetical protein